MTVAKQSGEQAKREAVQEAGMAKPGRKKRILIATDNFLPRWDGISRFLAEMIPRLKDNYDIVVVAPDNGPSPADKATSFRLVKIPLSRLRVGDFTFAKPSRKVIRKEIAACDLVFSQTIGPIGMMCIRLAKKEHKKVMAYIHSIEWELATRAVGINLFKGYSYALAKTVVRRVYNKVDLLIVPASSIAELFSWHKFKAEKTIIHLGVDTKKFIPPDKKDDAKKKLGIDCDSIVLGFHGRLGREKDLPTLLRAFIMVKKTYPKLVLLIVGDGLDSIKKKLVGVNGVILPGSTNNVVPYLQAMDIFCLTSLTETTSLSTLEAMACGVPVITNKVGFVKDYVRPPRNGLFFKGGDSYDLAKQILHLINDAELRKKISFVSRRFVEREFDWDKTARKIEETIEELLSRNSHKATARRNRK